MPKEQFHDITEFSRFTPPISSIWGLISISVGGLFILYAFYLLVRQMGLLETEPEEVNYITKALQHIDTKEERWLELPLDRCAQQLSLVVRESLDKELGSTTLYRTRHELNIDPQGILKIEDKALAQRCHQHILNLWGMKFQAISPDPALASQAIAETKTLLEDINHYCS